MFPSMSYLPSPHFQCLDIYITSLYITSLYIISLFWPLVIVFSCSIGICLENNEENAVLLTQMKFFNAHQHTGISTCTHRYTRQFVFAHRRPHPQNVTLWRWGQCQTSIVYTFVCSRTFKMKVSFFHSFVQQK